jgi:predicted DCC family thiol-disulfide oxidoreductase YuxK
VVFIENNQIYKKSDAVIKIASNLDGIYKYLKCIKIIPKFIRDYLYDLIAKNRYKLFGKRESCMIPDDRFKSRFL